MSARDNSSDVRTFTPYDNCLWGLCNLDWRRVMDLKNAATIPADHRCKRCEGTGNELMFMYRACPACDGKGFSRGNEHEFPG